MYRIFEIMTRQDRGVAFGRNSTWYIMYTKVSYGRKLKSGIKCKVR